MVRIPMPADHNDTDQKFPRESRDQREPAEESIGWEVLRVMLLTLSAVVVVMLIAWLLE